MALTWARDEILWLLRHGDNPPQQKGKGKAAEDLVDRQLPELLFHMEELRSKFIKNILFPSYCTKSCTAHVVSFIRSAGAKVQPSPPKILRAVLVGF